MVPLAPEEFQEEITKGKTIYDKAVLAIDRDGNKFRRLPDSAPNYNIQLDPPSMASTVGEHGGSISKLGYPLTDYVLACVENTGPGAEEPPYQNYIHDKGKAILCISNFASMDTLFGQPGRLFWSDLMAVCFSRTMTAHAHTTNGLEAIWRINIVNEHTKRVIKTCSTDTEMEFKPGDDGFYALLASDHGKGPARMLATYPQLFGRRFMTKVTVFTYGDRQNPCICWTLEELPPTQSADTVSKKTARKQRRMKAGTSGSSGSS